MLTEKTSRHAVLAAFCAILLIATPSARADDSWPDLSKPAKSIGGGEHDAAVVVGAENYFKVEHVAGAKLNANDWQAYLTGTLKVPADHVALLLDDDATVDQIRQAAAEKAAQTGAGGTLWFVFIGHGAPSKDGKDGLLVGIDAQQKAESVYSRSLSRNELLGVLSKGKQAKTVVLIDACFSGKSTSGQALVAGLQPLVTMSALSAADNRMILMTAARADQFAGPLPGGSRPAFSYLALGALRGWAADAKGAVTASGLIEYARKTLSLSRDRQQTPELSTPGSADAVLGSGREAGPDLAKMQREAASSSGRGFQVTSLPSVPRAEAPGALDTSASGLDWQNVDVDALGKYNAVFKLDKGDASAKDKAESWRQLAKEAPKFAELAAKRAAEWDDFATQQKAAEEAKQKRIKARNADWKKLGQLLAFDVVPETDKRSSSAQFLTAYMTSPGLEPVMAKALVAHVEAGPRRTALLALVKKAQEAATAGIPWVRIPGGNFTMGSTLNSESQPVHSVTIKSFQMAKTLVTNKQYRVCVAAGVCTETFWWGPPFAGDDQPVVGVDWNQATTYSAWVGGRLPSEAEWEYAARSGGKDRLYPWGNDGAGWCANAVLRGCESGTVPVCSKPAGNTEQGLCDMAGNAREWIEDFYHRDYSGAPSDGSAWEDTGSARVTRGGSYMHDTDYAHAAYRYYHDPSRQDVDLSFRPIR